MNPATKTTWKYLEANPKSLYRQLFLKGTRIRARTIYGMFMSDEEPMTAEQIAAECDLPNEAVHEAIAYCQSDPAEIADDFQREERLMDATGMNDPGYKSGGKFKPLSSQEFARVFK